MAQQMSESKDNEQTNSNSNMFESKDDEQKNSISIRWNSEIDINNYTICISQDDDEDANYSTNITTNGQLNICFSGDINKIFIDDRIYIKPSLIQTYNNSNNKFKELGIFIQTYIGGNNERTGMWNVGFGLGNNSFAFHPGYGHGGAARLEGDIYWPNESMGFEPQCDILYKVEIFVTIDSMVYLRVIDANNEKNIYEKQWKYMGSLFIGKQNTIFERKTFSLRCHYGYGDGKGMSAMFGDVDMNVAQRDKLNFKIDIIDSNNADSIKLNAFKAQMEHVYDVMFNLTKQLKRLKQMSEAIVGIENGEYVQNEMGKIKLKLDDLSLQTDIANKQ